MWSLCLVSGLCQSKIVFDLMSVSFNVCVESLFDFGPFVGLLRYFLF